MKKKHAKKSFTKRTFFLHRLYRTFFSTVSFPKGFLCERKAFRKGFTSKLFQKKLHQKHFHQLYRSFFSLKASKKGFNQVDFAVAIGLMIFMLGIILSYTNSYVIVPSPSSNLRIFSQNLEKISFQSLGDPSNWDWSNYTRPGLASFIYRRPVFLKEYNGTNNHANISVFLDLNEKAYKNSLQAYENCTPLSLEVSNTSDQDSDGFLESATLTFTIDVSANKNKTVYIYYSGDNSTQSSYVFLTPTNNTLNKTVLSEEKILGITKHKLDKFDELNLTHVKNYFNISRNFRLEIPSVNWSFGLAPPERADVVSKEGVSLFQNRNGTVSPVITRVIVW